MSLPLKDLRAKVPVEVWALIKGMASAQRKDEGEVVRDILSRWYDEVSHATTVAEQVLKIEGIAGNLGERRG